MTTELVRVDESSLHQKGDMLIVNGKYFLGPGSNFGVKIDGRIVMKDLFKWDGDVLRAAIVDLTQQMVLDHQIRANMKTTLDNANAKLATIVDDGK